MRGLLLIDVKTGASKHTGDDWGLIMSSKVIGTPDPRIVKVDMADRDGDIDQTEVIRGRVSYKNRPLYFSFTCTAHHSTWTDLRDEIAGFVHGKLLKIVDPDTPNHYYLARCTLGEPTYKGMAIMFLEISADAQPYRLSNTETEITQTVSTGDAVTLINDYMPVVPVITVSEPITISFGVMSFALANDTVYQIPEITLEKGANIIEITAGSGTITISYRQGVI